MADLALSPILVTGAHRSGTSWIGKMLAADALTAYISEPLNVLHRPGVFHAKVPHWYQYICEENESEYLLSFQQLLDFDYHLWDEIRSIRSLKDFLRMGRDFKVFSNGLLHGQRILIKDPFAVFSVPWFAKKLNCKVVIAVRHPAAFANSLKRLHWPFDFNNLLNQPLLMRDYLEGRQDEMRSIKSDDVIGQAALLWRLIYRSVYSILELNPGLIIVRHEDLSRDPVNKYRDLYTLLGLDYTPHVEEIILNSSNSENPVELSRKKTHSVKLDSLANMDNWKRYLTDEEVQRIHEITEEVFLLYYSAKEWQPTGDD